MGPLAVSSLAWPAEALEEGLALLVRLGCTAVEIAPFAVFGRWHGIGDAARRLRERLDVAGLRCCALQGVVYGAEDVAMFGTPGQQARLASQWERVAVLAGLLGARACVFGAPRQRDPGELGRAAAWETALRALRLAGPAFAAQGSAIAFEPVPACYGGRFVTGTADAVRLVLEADVPGVGLQIDTGAMFLGGEDAAVLAAAVPLARHMHISEPGLGPLGLSGQDHAGIARALLRTGYDGTIGVEMQAPPRWAEAVAGAVAFVRDTYGVAE